MEMIHKIRGKFRSIFKIKSTRPTRIVIELTNRCNLNCPYCLVGMQDEKKSVAHSDLDRSLGMMDMSLVKKIIKDAKAFGIEEVMLTFQGEPLLHKQFVDCIKLAKNAGLRTVVFTNGLLLNPELSRQIVRAGLNSVRFSVDGASQETYGLNRVGGQFQKAFDNMKDMARIAKEERKFFLKIVWQFIALSNNEHEIPKAQEMAKDIGVNFLVKTFAESIPELAPKNPKYRRNLQPKPCTDIYRMICVYWNGDVVPCCYDLVGKEKLGNVADNTITEIWESRRYLNFCKRVDEAVLHPENEPALCKSCLKWYLPSEVVERGVE